MERFEDLIRVYEDSGPPWGAHSAVAQCRKVMEDFTRSAAPAAPAASSRRSDGHAGCSTAPTGSSPRNDRACSGGAHGQPIEVRTAPASTEDRWAVWCTGGGRCQVPKDKILQKRPSMQHVLVAVWMHKDDFRWQRQNEKFKLPRAQRKAHDDDAGEHRLTWYKNHAAADPGHHRHNKYVFRARGPRYRLEPAPAPAAPMGAARRGQTGTITRVVLRARTPHEGPSAAVPRDDGFRPAEPKVTVQELDDQLARYKAGSEEL